MEDDQTKAIERFASEKTSRRRFVKRLAGLVALGLGVAGLEAVTASATTWTCCYSTDFNCIDLCNHQNAVAYDCNTSGCPPWCNCQSNDQGNCYFPTTGPC